MPVSLSRQPTPQPGQSPPIGAAIDAPLRAALDETKRRLQALFDHALDAFLLVNDDGRYIDANPAASLLSGYSRPELLSLSLGALTPVENRHKLSAEWQEFLKLGAQRREYTILRKDGGCVPVDLHAVARIAPGIHLVVMRDIMARRRAEDHLRDQAERLNILHAIDQTILSAGSVEEVAQAVLQAIHRLIPYWRGSVITFDLESDEFQIVAAFVNGEPAPDAPRHLSIAEAAQTEALIAALRRGESRVFDLCDVAPDWPEAEADLAAGMRYQITTPLIAQGELFGSLQLVCATSETFDSVYMPIVRELIDSLAIALRQARLFEQVRAGRERLHELSRRLVAAQEIERRQIASDLHDQIGQNLAVLNMNLSITRAHLSRESALRVDSRLAEAIQLVEQTVDQIRNVMSELRPALLDDCGLVPALRWYTRHFARHTGLAVLLEVEMPRGAARLPSDLETALFRIAQEALTNVVKHASATLATLKLTIAGQSIRLVIGDDGAGFNAGAARRPSQRWSLGLMTMQERVEAFGGRLLIDSAPGQGTRIIAELTR